MQYMAIEITLTSKIMIISIINKTVKKKLTRLLSNSAFQDTTLSEITHKSKTRFFFVRIFHKKKLLKWVYKINGYAKSLNSVKIIFFFFFWLNLGFPS